MRGEGICGRDAIGVDGFADIEAEGCGVAVAAGVIEVGAATCAAGVVATGACTVCAGGGGVPADAGGGAGAEKVGLAVGVGTIILGAGAATVAAGGGEALTVGAGGAAGVAVAGGRTAGAGAAALTGACCFRMAFRTSPGREILERSILVLISSLSTRLERACFVEVCASLKERRYARTFSASCSSTELECVFFSVTPTSGSASRIALLLTSSSLARSLIRILLIRLFFPPEFPAKSSYQPHGVGFQCTLPRLARNAQHSHYSLPSEDAGSSAGSSVRSSVVHAVSPGSTTAANSAVSSADGSPEAVSSETVCSETNPSGEAS